MVIGRRPAHALKRPGRNSMAFLNDSGLLADRQKQSVQTLNLFRCTSTISVKIFQKLLEEI